MSIFEAMFYLDETNSYLKDDMSDYIFNHIIDMKEVNTTNEVSDI